MVYLKKPGYNVEFLHHALLKLGSKMSDEERKTVLYKRFGILLRDHIKTAVEGFIDNNEEAGEIVGELFSLGSRGVVFEPRPINFDFSSAEDEEESEEAGVVENDAAPKTGSPPKVSFGFVEEDEKFLASLGLGSSEEVADMKRAIAEVRGQGAESGNKITSSAEESEKHQAKADDKIDSEVETMAGIELVVSIAELTKKMTDVFKRHIFAFSYNRLEEFNGLKNSEGENLQFPDGAKIVLYLLDDRAWMGRLTDIVKAILKLEPESKRKLLLGLYNILKHYSEMEV